MGYQEMTNAATKRSIGTLRRTTSQEAIFQPAKTPSLLTFAKTMGVPKPVGFLIRQNASPRRPLPLAWENPRNRVPD